MLQAKYSRVQSPRLISICRLLPQLQVFKNWNEEEIWDDNVVQFYNFNLASKICTNICP